MTFRSHAVVALCLLAAPLVASCSPGLELGVDLRTDLVPGVEFDAVEIVLDGQDRAPFDAAFGMNFERGRRVHESRGMSQGRHRLEVRLLQGETLVVSRQFVLAMETSLIFPVLLTRDCRGVECPGSGDSAAESECLGARCVDPECGTLGDPACLETECDDASDCTSDTACITPVCADGGASRSRRPARARWASTASPTWAAGPCR